MPGIRRCPTDVSLKQKETKEQITSGKLFSGQRKYGKGYGIRGAGKGAGDPGLRASLSGSFWTTVALIARSTSDFTGALEPKKPGKVPF